MDNDTLEKKITLLSLKETRRRRAGLAVSRFNRMRPAIESSVRRQTGNPNIKVRVGEQTSTDGKTIWIKPPIQMAYRTRHNRALCGVREYGVSACHACQVNDEIKTLLDHEIGHIMYGSFDEYHVRGMESHITLRPWLSGKYYNRFKEQYDKDIMQNDVPFRPLIERANSMKHPLVSFATLVMEDVRIDTKRIEENPDEAEGYDALSADLLEFGIPTDDGYIHHVDMPLDKQAMMAFLFASRDFDLEGFFADEVVDALTDARGVELVRHACDAPDTLASFQTGLLVLEYFQEKGLLSLDPKDDDTEDEMMQALMDLLSALLGHGADPGEGTGKGGQPKPADGEGGDPTEKKGGGTGSGGWSTGKDGNSVVDGQGMTPEDIRDAAKSLDLLGLVPVNVDGPTVFEEWDSQLPGWGSGSVYAQMSEHEIHTPETLIAPALTSARLAFGVNARVERHRNQRSGKIEGRMLARRVPFGDDRIFGRRTTPDKRDYHVLIGMDISGSTGGSTLRAEKMAVHAMCTVLDRLGVTFEVWAHTTHDDERSNSYSYGPGMYLVKGPNQSWSKDTQRNLRTLASCGGNLDGHSLLFYRRQLDKSRATEKVLMYYTDGAMPASNYSEELEVMQSEISYCNKNRITLMAVGMGVDSPKEHGFDTVVVDVNNPNYRQVVDHLGKRLTK